MAVQIVEHASYALVHRLDDAHIVADVVLILPFVQLLARQTSLKEAAVAREVILAPGDALLRIHAIHLVHEAQV